MFFFFVGTMVQRSILDDSLQFALIYIVFMHVTKNVENPEFGKGRVFWKGACFPAKAGLTYFCRPNRV